MVRDDYLLRIFNLLSVAIAEAVRRRQQGQPDAALIVLLQAQEKLFARQAEEFISRSVDEQLAMLERGEQPQVAREKWFGYASLMREAGRVYEGRDRRDLAAGAYQVALHTLLTAGAKFGPLDDQRRAEARELLRRLPVENLPPPLLELLQQQLPSPA